MDSPPQGPPEASAHQITLQWQDICYNVTEKKRGEGAVEKPILQNISGHALPTSFTAILGASGSGKTSLLSVLADRLLRTKGASLTGRITMNGQLPPPDYRARCAYVQQTDVFYPHATVRETAVMAARLRLGKQSTSAKTKRAEDVLQMLGLTKAMETKVGDGARVKGISGGEMKRLGIACEIVSSPGLIMLDEPTSGLDSSAALNVVRCLNELGLSGRPVIASIHQPGSPIYALFGNIIVLAEGRTAYFGLATTAMSHFDKIGFTCPTMFNPADYMLQITAVDCATLESENESREALKTIFAANQTVYQAPAQSATGVGSLSAIEAETSYSEQFVLLYLRILRDATRNRLAIILKLVQGIFTALIMVGLYADLNSGGVVQITINNITALLFFIVINGLFGPLFGTIQAFAPEVNVVLRERMNNLYAMAPYYFAKLLVLLPMELIPLFISQSVAYWCLQLNHSADRYLMFLLITFGMTFSSTGVGLALAAATAGNVQAASAAVAPIAIILLLLGGFYINRSTIPVFIRWLSQINYVNWSYNGLIINQFHGYTVRPHGAVNGSDVPCLQTENITKCEDGVQILNDLLNNGDLPIRTESEWIDSMWSNFLCICICIAVFNLLGYIALVTKGPKYLEIPRTAEP
jgi:ABC-type multidrug transport system ATPase subunit